jgi:hypothetical protein
MLNIQRWYQSTSFLCVHLTLFIILTKDSKYTISHVDFTAQFTLCSVKTYGLHHTLVNLTALVMLTKTFRLNVLTSNAASAELITALQACQKVFRIVPF